MLFDIKSPSLYGYRTGEMTPEQHEERRALKRLAARLRRERLAVGEVTDVDGVLWGVTQVRPTKHGFDVLYGYRWESYFSGVPKLIATKSLIDYWQAHRLKPDTTIYDLPIGRTTIKRMRKRFGFDQKKDARKFWKAHAKDLKALTPGEFGERYGFSEAVVKDWRLVMCGRVARELDWWQGPATLEILRTQGLTLREIGEKLGIGTSHANRLRKRALAMQQLPQQLAPAA